MRRRSVLALFGGIAAAGCSTPNGTTDTPAPAVEASSVSALDRRCTDAESDAAAVAFEDDGTSVAVTGTVSVPRTDSVLYLRTIGDGTVQRPDGTPAETATPDPEDAVVIRVDYGPSESDDAPGSDCAGVVDYEATATLSRAPERVVVRHVNLDGDEYVLERVTTAAP